MPSIDPKNLSKAERHRLVIGSVVPRPIAWITTVCPQGVVNLAPFSYFMGVTASPPCVAVSIGHREPVKDTLRNLRQTGEAVVQLVPPEHLETVNRSGAEFGAAVSEVEELGLEVLPSERVAPPRLAAGQIALECKLREELSIGTPGATLCVLEVVLAHVDSAVATDDGLPDPRKLRAVARLGDLCYLPAESWQVVEQSRPAAPRGKGVEDV